MHVERDRGLFVCEHCGSQQELPGILDYLELGGETARSCPNCSTPLSDSRLDGFPLLCCSRCFGMLIDMNWFAPVVDAVRTRERVRRVLPRRQNPGDRLVDCPVCRQAMLGHLYGGPGNIVIDTCERCLVNWLDAGELRRVAAAPEGSY